MLVVLSRSLVHCIRYFREDLGAKLGGALDSVPRHPLFPPGADVTQGALFDFSAFSDVTEGVDFTRGYMFPEQIALHAILLTAALVNDMFQMAVADVAAPLGIAGRPAIQNAAIKG